MHEQKPVLGLTGALTSVTMFTAFAAVAQLVEHLTENQGVPSSSLGCGTGTEPNAACGRGSVVEHLLAKERVVGSNPIARFLLKRRRSQVERQRSAKPRARVQIPSSPLGQSGWQHYAASHLLSLWGGGETADAADLKSAGGRPHVGSNPTRPTALSRPFRHQFSSDCGPALRIDCANGAGAVAILAEN